MSLGNRTASVTDRIAHALQRGGLSPAEILIVRDTLTRTFEDRPDRDAHHFAVLHPARNALILMHDCGVLDVTELCAAIRFDGLRPGLAPLGYESIDGLVSAVPRPEADDEGRLLEELVTASDAVRRIAVADLLDHARHLHLMEPSGWQPLHAHACAIYLPVAARTDAVLARRLQRWCEMFADRWLPRVRP